MSKGVVEMADEKKVGVSEDVRNMADTMKKGLDLDKSTGVATEKEADKPLFEQCMPEGVTVESDKVHSNFRSNFVAAGGLAFGEMMIDAMKKNTNLKDGHCGIKMGGRDSVGYHFERSHEYPNRLAGEGVVVTKHGVLTTDYQVKGGQNSGQLKKVKEALFESANKILGS